MTMSPEHWEAVKKLFQAALEQDPARRSGFLKERCEDASVRAEVERLLGEHDEAGTFLSTPAVHDFSVQGSVESPAQGLAESEMLVGRFRIVSFLARGGMGVVYKAEDTRLHRLVALKFLPANVADDRLSLARFQREAQAASVLTHANICTIYDIGEHQGRAFIAMEYLEGMTLRQRMVGRPLDVDFVLNIAIDISDGLDAAHAAGVIHRDVKPSNIFVTKPGNAKILDFGVAKMTFTGKSSIDSCIQTSPLAKEHLTSPGAAVGTVAYMSPEQVRGKELDARTDLFSFGVVLYEMTTGALPFRGDTTGAIFDSILNRTPVAPVRINPDMPTRLEDIINKALEKDRELRYQSAAELRADLKRLKRDTDTGAGPSDPAPITDQGKTNLRAKSLVTASVVLIIAAMFFGYRTWHKPVQTPKATLKLRQLTASSAENFIEYALISPDGKYLAYDEKAGGLFLSLIETGETRLLIPSSGDFHPWSWFPDGTQLLVITENGPWKVSVLTGTLSKLREDAGRPSVSPDGTRILYYGEAGLWIMGPNGEAAHRVMVVEPTDSVYGLSWAPTGQRFAYVITRHRANEKVEALIESRDVDGRDQPTVILSSADLMTDLNLTRLCWLPDGRLIYSKAEPPPNQNDSNLWAITVDPTTGQPRDEPVQLTYWPGFDTTFISATADGRRLSFVKSHLQTSIYVAQIGTNVETGLARAERLVTDTWARRADGWTLDSRAIYLSSNRSGKFAIYRQDIHRQVSEPVISGAEDYSNVHLSADGASLLYTATGTHGLPGSVRLMSMPVEGGTPSVLASGEYQYQCALPPSNVCVLSEKKANQLEFYSLDPKRGPAAEPFKSTGDVRDWSLSPDGQYIAMVENDEKGEIHLLSLSKGTFRQMDLGKWHRLQSISWSPDGRTLYVTSFASTGTTLLSAGLDGSVRILFQQGHNWLCCPKAAPNGRLLAFSVMEAQRDAAMIENF